jgi:glycyl-tRNA synthetase
LPADRIDAIVSLCKRRGLAYPSCEIYGGSRASWDFGPLGVELKENIRRVWWRATVQSRDDVVGLDSAILLAPEVWRASGHVEDFVERLVSCQSCHRRWRVEQLADGQAGAGRPGGGGSVSSAQCPGCGAKGSFGEPEVVSGLLSTSAGAAGPDGDGGCQLRPETVQGIFLNFANVMLSARRRPPFGIGQVGRSFRNELPPAEFLLRSREFEQMELAFFVRPGTDADWHEYWLAQRWAWYTDLGLAEANLRLTEQPAEQSAQRAKRTVDIEYRFGLPGAEWAALEAVANRTDADLSAHTKASGADLSFFDQEAGERWVPYVICPSAGLTRCVLAVLLDAYAEDEAPNARGVLERRTVLRLDPRLAPVKAAVLPLSRNPEVSPRARELAARLRANWNTEFDDAGAIGRRYRRQDEVGTPYCVTVDFESLTDNAVTVRERDSMRQERVDIDKVPGYLAERLAGC